MLLLLTARLSRQGVTQYRILAASAVGGLYSLVILADGLSLLLTVFGKLLISALIVLVAFKIRRALYFIKCLIIFYFSNIIVLGFVMAIQLCLARNSISVNNGVPYFDISARALLISALLAYLISLGIIKLYNRSISRAELYTLVIYKGEREYRLFAFADSGNKLREPFSDLPVIVADKSKIDVPAERVIPYNTVGGEGMLSAFRPDKITISNGKRVYETDRVYIALSDVQSSSFSAILNPEILNI